MHRGIDLEKISSKVREIIESSGMRFYDLDYNDLSRTLRVYIDREQGGITIGDCQKISNTISRELDADDLFGFPYTLEVSSPGVDRTLSRPEHYSWAIGKHVEIDAGGSRITGYLRGITDDGVMVASGEHERKVLFSSIKRAKVVEELHK